MSYIEVNNLWKEYDDQVVIEKLNLTINKGDFISIVGASGCGKSTFLRMLLGQETASDGEILLEGKPLSGEPSVDRGIVFQRYSVFPHLTVLQNVLLGLEFEHKSMSSRLLSKLWGEEKKTAVQECEEILKAVGLGHALKKYPDQLSGGMQQRLAIAQSFIKKPRILLLDEPFGALDPGIRGDMHALVIELWKKTGTTIFMVTHDLSEGFYLGTRLLVFDKSRHDPHAPERFGAGVTYDLDITAEHNAMKSDVAASVIESQRIAENAVV